MGEARTRPPSAADRWGAQCPQCGDKEHLLAFPRIAVAMTENGTEDQDGDYLFEGDPTPVECRACCVVKTTLGACRDAYDREQDDDEETR